MASANKQLRSEIRSRIESGESRENIYNDLAHQYAKRSELAEILTSIPSMAQRRMHKPLYAWLLALLGLTTTLDVYMLSYVLIVYDLLLFYVVYSYRIRYYGWIWFRAIVAFVVFLVMFVLNILCGKDVCSLPLAGMIFTLLIPTGFIAYKLENSLTTDFLVKGEKYIDENGHEKTRVYHEFRE